MRRQFLRRRADVDAADGWGAGRDEPSFVDLGGDSAPGGGGGGGGGPSIGVLGNFNSDISISNTTFTQAGGGNGGAPASSGGEPGVTGATGMVGGVFRAPEPQEEDEGGDA